MSCPTPKARRVDPLTQRFRLRLVQGFPAPLGGMLPLKVLRSRGLLSAAPSTTTGPFLLPARTEPSVRRSRPAIGFPAPWQPAQRVVEQRLQPLVELLRRCLQTSVLRLFVRRSISDPLLDRLDLCVRELQLEGRRRHCRELLTFWYSLLCSGDPLTTTAPWWLPCRVDSAVRRSSPIRDPPLWQLKQLAVKIGRISRSKLSDDSAADAWRSQPRK